ncbi:S9 family peptidase [Paraflavitalea soli]|uniref:S9 family peptidase n=1 Tax=Paraflavitalea soli TaxID=2315862 RepID=A0A3B7MW05_9BACT|nr:prolyl oligopeptidase family serine peptidase [Paraflavitalea soli]AXY77389.1 S9 family peptidase [Paraflavitalea soli]
MKSLVSLTLFLLLAVIAPAQKKNLTPDDYGKWQTLSYADVSANGEWVAYIVASQEENDTLYVVNRLTNKTYKLEFATNFELSKDNQWIAWQIGVSYKEAEKLRDQKQPIRYKMGLLNLATGKKQIVQDVTAFRFSRNGKLLAISLEPPKENKDKGAVLLLRKLADSSTRTIGNVTAYAFNKKSDYLAYIVESANIAGNSVELFNLDNYSLRIIASDTCKFSKLTWQKEGEGLAFYKTFKKETYEEENAMVYAYVNIYKAPALKIFDGTSFKGFPDSMRINNASNLVLSDDMNAAFFGIKSWTAKPKKDEKKASDSSKLKADTTKKGDIAKKTDSTKSVAAAPKKEDKLAAVDVWHWKDTEIQPRQKMTYTQDKDLSLHAVWNIDNNSYFQLSKDDAPYASYSDNRKIAVVYTNKKYKPAFKEDYADYYLVNTRTGEQKLLFEKMLAGFFTAPQPSTEGKYVVYFKDKNWWSYNTTTGQAINLTEKTGATFWNTRDDHPATKPPYGFGGWLKGDKELLVYDEYNVWALNPDGKGARKLTDGEKEEIQYRVNRLDFEDPFIDDTKPIYLSAYGDKSKKFGYYKLEKNKVSKLLFEDATIFRLSKAKDANVFTYSKQDYNISPELYVTENFTDNKKIVATNPQQQNYYWGKSELVSFTNKKGKPMQGALFYPANYEPGKKYPMIVYIYEILSNTVHMYTSPSVRSAYNTTNYTTNGYFIFRPDIVYDINEPGTSAVDCVVPAVEEVLKTGMIDKDKIGLMGHSWGAYQTSFIITQTNLFKAACAGAPLTDLISMSLSIYWNSGTPDQKIFETSQGRFDGPWYDRMDAHMRNSPMFNADKIKTPLLVAFGDKDGAVDWHQGIEMYGTMRRMEKEHVMLVYADENHGLAKKENQIDYQKRQREWFDHFLLGKPAPAWITEGTSYQDKMKAVEKENKSTQ